jgi:transcriptional regulator with XRE-family HTH domain
MHIDAIGDVIKHQREARNLTQQELANLLGITSAAVCQWERKGTVPRAKTLAKLAQALGLTESLSESSALRPIQDHPVSVATQIEKLKAIIAETTGVEKSRVGVNITIADPSSQSVAA